MFHCILAETFLDYLKDVGVTIVFVFVVLE
jgi:hypothetical protein